MGSSWIQHHEKELWKKMPEIALFGASSSFMGYIIVESYIGGKGVHWWQGGGKRNRLPLSTPKSGGGLLHGMQLHEQFVFAWLSDISDSTVVLLA